MTIEKALPPGSPVEWLIELSEHAGSQRSKLLTVAAIYTSTPCAPNQQQQRADAADLARDTPWMER